MTTALLFVITWLALVGLFICTEIRHRCPRHGLYSMHIQPPTGNHRVMDTPSQVQDQAPPSTSSK